MIITLKSLGRWFKSGSVDCLDFGAWDYLNALRENSVGSGIRTHAHIRGPECSRSRERVILSLAP